jgi:NAD(P)-dependent dehydrogenase (short-subunit alcohol dehydrogenase family)
MANILITGTSTGIGLATALLLARAGHKVYATMRRPERSPELVAAARAESLALEVLRLDVDDDESVRGAFAEVFSRGERLDVLVNNAGISAIGPIEELPLETFRRTMETNYFGALRCIKAVLPRMREQRSGCIVNVTSVAGRVAIAPQGAYAASKSALEALSEVLAQEVKGFNIRVAVVEPGIIETPIFTKGGETAPESHYPHERRLRAMFAASLTNPAPATLVAEQIRRIIEGDSWKLRYPAGPDARPMMTLRRLASDEEWIERYGEPDDEAWCKRVEQDFLGLDLRPYLQAGGAPDTA